MSRPNIFNYAKKELSQDAIMAWFFACLHSDEKEYKQIGINFINYIFEANYSENDISIEKKSPELQCHKMDIYSVVKIGNFIHPIIVEDKTDTFLHSNQFEKYCEQVAEWTTEKKYLKDLRTEFNNKNLNWGDMLYVYFKSGFTPKFEMNAFFNEKRKAKQAVISKNNKIQLKIKEIYISDMISFIESLHCNDDLILEYYEFLTTRCALYKESYDNALLQSDNEKYNKYFSNAAGCSKLFERAFGEYKYFRNELYQGWASRDVFVMNSKINNDNRNDIYYCFRFESCSYKKGKNGYHAYAFQFQQYRYEKGTIGSNIENFIDEKNKQGKEILALCKDIIEEMNHPVDIVYMNPDSTRGIDGKMLFKIFICKNNSPQRVCDFIKEFTIKICERVDAKRIYFPDEREK